MAGLSKPQTNMLILFNRRYYKETDGLKLDVGVYMKALEVGPLLTVPPK